MNIKLISPVLSSLNYFKKSINNAPASNLKLNTLTKDTFSFCAKNKNTEYSPNESVPDVDYAALAASYQAKREFANKEVNVLHKETLEEALTTLKPAEATAVKMYHDKLEGTICKSLKEIGRECNVSPAKIFDIYTKAKIKELNTLHKETFDEALAELRPREAAVLTMSYGLDGNKPKTYSEIAGPDINPQRIKRIKNLALYNFNHIMQKKLESSEIK